MEGGGEGCVCTRVCPCEFVFMCVCTCASAFPDLCARCFVIRICVLKWHPVLCSQSKSAHSSPLTSTCDATRVQLHLKRHICGHRGRTPARGSRRRRGMTPPAGEIQLRIIWCVWTRMLLLLLSCPLCVRIHFLECSAHRKK